MGADIFQEQRVEIIMEAVAAPFGFFEVSPMMVGWAGGSD